MGGLIRQPPSRNVPPAPIVRKELSDSAPPDPIQYYPLPDAGEKSRIRKKIRIFACRAPVIDQNSVDAENHVNPVNGVDEETLQPLSPVIDVDPVDATVNATTSQPQPPVIDRPRDAIPEDPPVVPPVDPPVEQQPLPPASPSTDNNSPSGDIFFSFLCMKERKKDSHKIHAKIVNNSFCLDRSFDVDVLIRKDQEKVLAMHEADRRKRLVRVKKRMLSSLCIHILFYRIHFSAGYAPSFIVSAEYCTTNSPELAAR